MIQENLKERTYTTGYDIGNWSFIVEESPAGINLHNDEERATWLADLVSSAIAALTGFAHARSIDVSTDSKGEDSFFIKSATEDDLQGLDKFLRSTLDVSNVDIWLNLQCIRPRADGSLEEFLLEHAVLHIWNNLSKYGLTDPKSGLVTIYFSLDTDIYSPLALGDNRTLAALNIPRLRSFLRRLGEFPSLKLSDDYSLGELDSLQPYGIVDRYGFKMPDDPAAFEEMLRCNAKQ